MYLQEISLIQFRDNTQSTILFTFERNSHYKLILFITTKWKNDISFSEGQEIKSKLTFPTNLIQSIQIFELLNGKETINLSFITSRISTCATFPPSFEADASILSNYKNLDVFFLFFSSLFFFNHSRLNFSTPIHHHLQPSSTHLPLFYFEIREVWYSDRIYIYISWLDRNIYVYTRVCVRLVCNGCIYLRRYKAGNDDVMHTCARLR